MTKNPAAVRRATHIKEIVRIFLTHGFGLLPVVDKKNHLPGVITKKIYLLLFAWVF